MKKPKEKKPVHLHWLWHRGENCAIGVTLAYGFCGAGNLPVGQFTPLLAKATCAACKSCAASYKAAMAKAAAASPAPAPAAPSKGQGRATGKANGQGLGHPSSPAPKGHRRIALPASGATIKALTPRNPRKPGTGKHQRMALLLQHNGKTVQAFLDAGGNPETLRNAIIEKIVEVTNNV